MLIKMLFVALLAYLAVRAVLNLIRVIVTDKDGRSALGQRERPEPLRTETRSQNRTTRRVPKSDVEDARWVDVD